MNIQMEKHYPGKIASWEVPDRQKHASYETWNDMCVDPFLP